MKKSKPVFYMLFFTGLILLFILLLQPLEILHFQDYIAILFPKGQIAYEQRNLLLIIQGLMLLVIIPVYILTFVFSWKYRADNKKATYDPHLIDNLYAEVVWWGLPLVMTLIVIALTWIKTVELDPYKPIESDKKPLHVQAIAMQWNWLFIYPEEKRASLNHLEIPIQRPIHFDITADAPMNSLWIPELGGQIYAMPGMKTELNLIANQSGKFRGQSSNLSGVGFSNMHFMTLAQKEEEFENWVKKTEESQLLSWEEYQNIAKPSTLSEKIYRIEDSKLFEKIMMKYMHPPKKNGHVR